jgi:hypothetical protein
MGRKTEVFSPSGGKLKTTDYSKAFGTSPKGPGKLKFSLEN